MLSSTVASLSSILSTTILNLLVMSRDDTDAWHMLHMSGDDTHANKRPAKYYYPTALFFLTK